MMAESFIIESTSIQMIELVPFLVLNLVRFQLYITQESKFNTLGELVHHHSVHPAGLICTLLYPVPKKGPKVFSLSPTKSDEWEVDRTEILMRNKV